jgi:hypothetical protein
MGMGICGLGMGIANETHGKPTGTCIKYAATVPVPVSLVISCTVPH